MSRFMIVAMAFLFVFVGMQQIAQADEVKAAVEDAKGKANANAQKAKGEAKALTEEAQGNKVKGEMEPAKEQTTKQPESGIQGEAKELKAKTVKISHLNLSRDHWTRKPIVNGPGISCRALRIRGLT